MGLGTGRGRGDAVPLKLEWRVSDALLFDNHAGIVIGYDEAVAFVFGRSHDRAQLGAQRQASCLRMELENVG